MKKLADKSCQVSPRSHRLFRTLAGLIVLAPSVILAQVDIDVRTPSWRAEVPFTAISGVRELSSGEILVIDAREQRILVLSADGSRQRVIARAGAGPGEVRQPMAALAMTSDSTAVLDAALRRALIFDSQGGVARHVRVPETVGSMAFGAAAMMEGRFLIFPERWSAAGSRTSAVPVLRWEIGGAGLDTVAWIQRAALPAALREPEGVSSSGRVIPYLANDVLVVGTGNVFGILHANPYRLSIYSSAGRLVRTGPVIRITPVRTTEQERSMMPPGWIPAEKPPFTETGHLVDFDGRIWVRRSRVGGASTTTYDVFSADAERVAEISFTDGRFVVGAGVHGVYVVGQSDEGFQYLERYRVRR